MATLVDISNYSTSSWEHLDHITSLPLYSRTLYGKKTGTIAPYINPSNGNTKCRVTFGATASAGKNWKCSVEQLRMEAIYGP